jgi:hypothetical protein
MRKNCLKFATLAAVTLPISCSTATKKSIVEPHKTQSRQAHVTETKTPILTKSGAKRPSSVSVDAEYAAFFSRMVVSENDYTENDRQIFNSIPPSPSGGTIHEAALVIGVLRDVLTPIGAQRELARASDGANVSRNSLQSKTQEKGLDLIESLSSNPYLKGRTVYLMAHDALQKGGNSSGFAQNLYSVLRKETSDWEQFATKLASTPQSPNSATAATVPTSAPNALTDAKPPIPSPGVTSSNTSPDQVSTSSNGLTEPSAEGAQILAKAQELAAKEQIEQAILAAKKIPQNSESYTAARQNIKIWSDRATQDLRKQAAYQYRASSATNDPSGKRVYLAKARSLLEEALTRYPESSNLETIKENLEIINGELSRLD